MTDPMLDCLCSHRSIRKLMDEPLDPETLETILHTGTRAATAENIQPYSFLVVDDRQTPERRTLRHSTTEFPEWESAGIVENLRRAGFRFA